METLIKEDFLVQGTDAWKELRKQYVTATDSSIILGISPFKTPYKLWRQKMDLDPPEEENEAMRRGSMLEGDARLWLENVKGIKCNPKVLFKDFMMASLDGITEDGIVVEIKCGEKSYQQAINDEIPNYYFCQIQHQIYVSNAKLAYYVAFNGETGIIIPVEKDQNFINKMIEKEIEFYECLISFTTPKMTTKDYQIRSDPQWNKLAENYRKAYQELKHAEQLEQSLRQELIALAGEQSVHGAGIKLSKISKKGSIDYTIIPQLQGLNLDPYRKNPVEYWKIGIE